MMPSQKLCRAKFTKTLDRIANLQLKNDELLQDIEKYSLENEALQKTKKDLEMKIELLENNGSKGKCSMCHSLQKTLDSVRDLYSESLSEKDRIINFMESKLKEYNSEKILYPKSLNDGLSMKIPLNHLNGGNASPDSTIILQKPENKLDAKLDNKDTTSIKLQLSRGKKRHYTMEEISPPLNKRSKLNGSNLATNKECLKHNRKHVIVPDTCALDNSLISLTEVKNMNMDNEDKKFSPKTNKTNQKLNIDLQKTSSKDDIKIVPETVDAMEMLFGSSASDSGDEDVGDEDVETVMQGNLEEDQKYSLLSVLVCSESSEDEKEEEKGDFLSPNMLSSVSHQRMLQCSDSEECKIQDQTGGVEVNDETHLQDELVKQDCIKLPSSKLSENLSKLNTVGSTAPHDDTNSVELLKCPKNNVISGFEDIHEGSKEEESPVLIKSKLKQKVFSVSSDNHPTQNWTNTKRNRDKNRKGKCRLEMEFDPNFILSPKNLRQMTLSQAFQCTHADELGQKATQDDRDIKNTMTLPVKEYQKSKKSRQGVYNILEDDEDDIFQRQSHKMKKGKENVTFKIPEQPLSCKAMHVSNSTKDKGNDTSLQDVTNIVNGPLIKNGTSQKQDLEQSKSKSNEDVCVKNSDKIYLTQTKGDNKQSKKMPLIDEIKINGSLDPDLELSVLCQDTEKDPLVHNEYSVSGNEMKDTLKDFDTERIDPLVSDSVASLTDFRIEDLNGKLDMVLNPLTSTCVEELESQGIPCSYKSVKFCSGRKKLVLSSHLSESLLKEDDKNKLHESLEDSFDRVPQKLEPGYAYVDVVRKQNERRQLTAYDCKECRDYYKACGLSEEEIKQKKQGCGKHRSRYSPPSTPEHFWDVGFPDTPTCQERGYIKTTTDENEERPIFRRKRGYRKMFKSKNEGN